VDRDALTDVHEDVRLDRGDRGGATGAMVAKAPLWVSRGVRDRAWSSALKGLCRSHRT
jgi:hypothetical protein